VSTNDIWIKNAREAITDWKEPRKVLKKVERNMGRPLSTDEKACYLGGFHDAVTAMESFLKALTVSPKVVAEILQESEENDQT